MKYDRRTFVRGASAAAAAGLAPGFASCAETPPSTPSLATSDEGVKTGGSRLIPVVGHVCPNGSHLSLYDDQQDYMSALISFLKDVEAGTFVPERKA